jgi:putative ABC transport system permease protein
MDIEWQRLVASYPEENGQLRAEFSPLREIFPGESDTRLVEVLLAVGLFVLVIAAANVANLLLARAEGRNQEIAVRVPLGAKRARILRQLLTESVLLGSIGGAIGIVTSFYGVISLVGIMLAEIPRAFMPQLQPAVLVFAVVASIGVGVLFGLAPALQALRSNQRDGMGEGRRGGTVGKARKRLRSAFVIGEVALALGLLAGAAALTSIADDMVNSDLGFESAGLLTFRTIASGNAYDDELERARFHREIEQELLALPQVTGIAVMPERPRGQNVGSTAVVVDGREVPEGGPPASLWHTVNTDYFATMGVPLRTGRLFEGSDRADAPPVVVVNEAFANFHFPDEDPVGHRLTIRDESREIIGVVGNVFHTRVVLRGALSGMAYLPMEQDPIRDVAYTIRTSGEPTALSGDLRPAIWRVEPRAAVSEVQSLDAFVAAEMAAPRALGLIMALFGLLALILSAMGIWGVMAHAVAQRNREIGIRMALGAKGSQVMNLVLRNGVMQAGLGILIGTPLAFFIRKASEGVAVDFQVSMGAPGS